MALSKFSVRIPDTWTTGVGKTTADLTAARFGHINRVVDYVNEATSELLSRTGTLNASAQLELQRVSDLVVGSIAGSTRLAAASSYLVPASGNVTWAVEVTVSAVCTSGTAGVNTGDSFLGKFNVLYKRISGTGTVVGVNGAFSITDASMSTAQVLFTVGAANDLRINFQAPSTASSTPFSVKATVTITDIIF
jgi:hypothetical protein